jgi:hypothetical protein
MAILAGIKLESLHKQPATVRPGLILWQLFFLLFFIVGLVLLLIKPYNPEGIALTAAIPPVALFTLALFSLTLYFWSPGLKNRLIVSLIMICLAYTLLFYNTRPIADAFNPDIRWPAMINKLRAEGNKFYIYRPRNRIRFMSPDLFYVDFMAGPADRYYWDGEQLKRDLLKEKALVLSDTESWKKLGLKQGKIIAEDNYSRLISN